MLKLNENYIALHVHSVNSLRDGIMKIKDLNDYAIKQKKRYVCVTDHGGIGGWIELYEQCNKNRLIPIFGIEGYIHLERNKYLEEKEGKPDHIILLAQNEIGFKNIIKIHNDAWKHFYKKPIMSYEFLFNNSEGIIVATACVSGTLPKFLKEKNIIKADEYIETMKKNFPGRFFIELQIIDFEDQKTLNLQLIQMSKKHNIPTIITNDAHYLNPEDNSEHQLSLLLQSKQTVKDLEEGKGWEFTAQDLYMKNEQQLYTGWKQFYQNDPIFTEEVFIQSLNNSDLITNTIETVYLEHPPRLPHYENGPKKLKEMIIKGFGEKVEQGLIPEDQIDAYMERVKYEIKTINDLELVDYFLLINDIINFCDENSIAHGPGRGSVSASLVTYLMGITKLDPIKYKFIFERFLNPARKTKLKFV